MQNNRIELTKELLKKGAKVNVVDKRNQSPLWLASYSGHTELVKLLLKHKANKEVGVPLLGKVLTPIIVAKQGNHDDIVELLR